MGRKTAISRVITQIDTIYHTDTIIAEKPVYFAKYTRDTIRFAVRDTIRERDTLYINLPREVKEYRDSNYYARVSGFLPELEYIETYQRERIITQTNSVPSRKRWGVGIQAGYGVSASGLTPYIGVGISYNLIVF